MVSVEEQLASSRKQLSQAELNLRTQKRKLQSQETQLQSQEISFREQTRPEGLDLKRQISLSESFGAGGVGGAFKKIETKKTVQRKEFLPKFEQAQEQISQAKVQLQSRQQELSTFGAGLKKQEQFELGRKFARKGKAPFFQSSEVVAGFRFEQRGEKAARSSSELARLGLKPIVSGETGAVVGFEDIAAGRSFEVSEIGSIGDVRLKGLEEKGIVTLTQQAPETLQSVDASALMSVEPARQGGFRSGVKEFFLTKPDPSREIFGTSPAARTVEFIATAPFQLASGIKQEFQRSGREIKQEEFFGAPALGVTIGAVGTIIPESPAGQLGTAAGLKLISKAPQVVRTIAQVGFGGLGIVTALDPELSAEERVGGGLIAGLSIAGLGSETLPFIKGGFARFSTKFKPVKGGEVDIGGVKVDTKFIGDLAFDGGKGQIGLIPESIGTAQGRFQSGAGALERGGFGFSPSEQIKGFGGKELRLTTSQRGLQTKDGQFKVDPEISDLGFFFTPADPITGIPQTRVSRLGLQDFFKRPTGDVSFSLVGTGRPQIIVTEPVPIITTGRTGTGGKARITPKGSTELEVTSLSNIEVIEQLGVTTVKGQKVDLILGRLSGATTTRTSGRGGAVGDIISTRTPTTIPITSILSPSLGATGLITNLTQRTSSKTGGLSTGQGGSFPTLDLVPPSGIGSLSGGLSGGLSPNIIPQSSTGIPTLDLFRAPQRTKRPPRRLKSRKRKTKKVTKIKRKRPRVPIRPSFTGIIVGVEEAAIVSETFGVTPGQIRGLATGFERPKRKKKKNKKK